jgi:peptidoglycan/LPS O-acetylase OafA/YrhL
MESVQNVPSISPVGIRERLRSLSQSISTYLDDGKQKNPIYVLDGVRAIACFLVVFFHVNFVARGGNIWRPIHDFGSVVGALALFGQSGVILFFLLSCFLLFLPYSQ